jgi:hypothetical protein
MKEALKPYSKKDYPTTTNNAENSLLALDLGKQRKTTDASKVATASSLPPGLNSQGISSSSLWKDEAKAMLLLDFLRTA